MWYAGEEMWSDRTGTKLRNVSTKQSMLHPPIHGWREIIHGRFGVADTWKDCGLQLGVDAGVPPCPSLTVRAKKPNQVDGKVLGTYSHLSGRWSLGRKVSGNLEH